MLRLVGVGGQDELKLMLIQFHPQVQQNVLTLVHEEKRETDVRCQDILAEVYTRMPPLYSNLFSNML